MSLPTYKITAEKETEYIKDLTKTSELLLGGIYFPVFLVASLIVGLLLYSGSVGGKAALAVMIMIAVILFIFYFIIIEYISKFVKRFVGKAVKDVNEVIDAIKALIHL